MSAIAQDLFELKCILKNIKIRLCSRSESGVKQLLALITSDGEVVLHYTYGELPPVIKTIPWFTDNNKTIQAICFDPSSSWLLAAAIDCSLYIIPALSLVDKKQKIDCKWSLNDVTHFPKHPQSPEAKPTSLVWWQTLDCNQNALVGHENGAIALISLTDGRCLGCCHIAETITGLSLCQDNTLDTVSLLINGDTGQQWRLMLEQTSVGYLWPPDSTAHPEDITRSRLHSLRQMGADKLASIKQRLVEARGGRRDSQSDTASESSHSDSTHSGPELLPCLGDTVFAPQYARGRYLFSAFYKPSSLLTIHAVDVETAPLFIYRVMEKINYLLLTDRLIYCVNNEANAVFAVSTQFSACRMEGDSSFNGDALVALFRVDGEKILSIFKLTDLTSGRFRKNKDKFYELPKTVEDLAVKRPRIDTCVIVTDCSVYKVTVSLSPVNKFVQLVTLENDLERAEKLSLIFGLNLQQLLEACGDLLIATDSFHSGIILYKQAKVHLLKRVLKLAIAADCRTLLKFIHLCLSSSRVDMSMATKIHIGNLAVMAYTELILRHGGQPRVANTKDFMNFLRFEEFYDQILAVNVACQAGHWNVVSLLAKSRGLQPEVVATFGQILQSARSPRATDRDFLFAISEQSLIQSLLILPQSGREVFGFVRANVQSFPAEVLLRLAAMLDPSQPAVVSLVNRLFRRTIYSSSLDTTIESLDLDDPDRSVTIVKDLVETFLIVILNLIVRFNKEAYNIELLEDIEPETPLDECPIAKMPDLRPLSCGYEHTAVVRNSNVYTMGVSTSGCLGLGPLLSQSSPPKLVQTLTDMKIKVLSVSCGRKHTLALSDYGVYAWGSNSYGQLGLGPFVQESPYPQIVAALAFDKIVEVSAGQYHSLALTSSGRVYTWGWGIHGQLGHGDCENSYFPRLLNFKEPIRQVAAGHAHSLILTTEGKLYGFGSNVFGQLESCQLETSKATRPVWVLLMPDMYTPIEKISTAYFHNIAVRVDQEVYAWGASPQEVRILQSRNVQKQNNGLAKSSPDSWKTCVHVYTGDNKKVIQQVDVGYRHSAILHNGQILWGKNKDDELSFPKVRDHDKISFFAHKFLHVSCGLDYTMALENTGKVLAWGSPSMAHTIFGRPAEEDNRSSSDSKVVVFKSTGRVIKIPTNLEGAADNFPIEVPGLPSMAITFNPTDHKLIFLKNHAPFSIFQIENSENLNDFIKPTVVNKKTNFLQAAPQLSIGQKTLHYVLETYQGFYDSDVLLSKCLEFENYQAASKIAMLEGHFGDSLGFQLTAFKKYMDSCVLDMDSIFLNKESYDNVKEKDQQFVELVVKNIQDDFNDKNYINSPAHILSSSSSLDSIRQWGDEAENQGGNESPCEGGDLGDVKQNMSHYVQSLKSSDAPPISSVSQLVSQGENRKPQNEDDLISYEIKDETTKEIIENASQLIEFYIKKIHFSENHILMQNILMRSIEFWLSNNLPVPILENVLLKNMDMYFYPLSILLFCKDFRGEGDEDLVKDGSSSAGFLKEFSTKFCLQLCSMVLENINKA